MINKLLYITTIILIVIIGSAEAKTRFFIQTIAQGDQNGKVAEGGLGYFETSVFDKIKENFPCAEINSKSTIVALLGHERMRQLLGTGDDNALQNIAGAMGCEYLLVLKIFVSGQSSTISAYCMDSKNAEMMANVVETAPYGNASLNAIDKVTKKLIDDLKEYEICPYSGPLTIDVKSELDDSKTDNVNCPCGGDVAVITTTRKTNATMKWELTKIGKNSCSGSAKYDLNEKMTIESIYPCIKCKNGDQGFTKITETNESEAIVEGLSNESVSEGQQVADARIMLYFLEDGTYNVLVKATSKKGVLKVTTEKKFEGMCESESEPKDTKNKSIDIPFVEVFGPYKGTAQDKVLSQKESKDVSNGAEKVTVNIDFTLTQKF